MFFCGLCPAAHHPWSDAIFLGFRLAENQQASHRYTHSLITNRSATLTFLATRNIAPGLHRS